MAKLRDVHQAMLEAQLEKLEGTQMSTALLAGHGDDVNDNVVFGEIAKSVTCGSLVIDWTKC